MSTILYGNLRAEIVGGAGVRVSLLAQRQPASGLLRPGQPSAPHRPRLLWPGNGDSRCARRCPGRPPRRIPCPLRIRQDDAA